MGHKVDCKDARIPLDAKNPRPRSAGCAMANWRVHLRQTRGASDAAMINNLEPHSEHIDPSDLGSVSTSVHPSISLSFSLSPPRGLTRACLRHAF